MREKLAWSQAKADPGRKAEVGMTKWRTVFRRTGPTIGRRHVSPFFYFLIKKNFL